MDGEKQLPAGERHFNLMLRITNPEPFQSYIAIVLCRRLQ